MGKICQLVLLASIVASCISYSIDSTQTMPGLEPPPPDFDISEYPVEFMNQLIASLSPEELDEMKQPTILGEANLVDRDGNTDNIPCPSHQDIQNYHRLMATDFEYYFIINNQEKELQQITHYVCGNVNGSDSYDNKCEPANAHKFNAYCCHQHKEIVALYVIPIPIRHLEVYKGHLYHKSTHLKYENFRGRVKKNFLMNSFCSCDQYKPAIPYSNNYECPDPKSQFFS